jgi:hypothetical protein
MTVCHVTDCDATAVYTVQAPALYRLRVCRKCRDELVAIHNYTLVNPPLEEEETVDG